MKKLALIIVVTLSLSGCFGLFLELDSEPATDIEVLDKWYEDMDGKDPDGYGLSPDWVLHASGTTSGFQVDSFSGELINSSYWWRMIKFYYLPGQENPGEFGIPSTTYVITIFNWMYDDPDAGWDLF